MSTSVDSNSGDRKPAKSGDRKATNGSAPATAQVDRAHASEKEKFGGMKFGAAFFGWLTAVGTTVLLVALVAGVGGAVGFANETDAAATAEQLAEEPEQAGIVGAIVLLVILLIAYFAGGYVAGRMARFSGAKQGLAVWIWAVVIAILLAVVGAIAGSQFDVLSQLDGLPQIPISGDDLTTGSIVAAVLVILVTLGGAILGGLAGMRYHRRIDEFGRTHA